VGVPWGGPLDLLPLRFWRVFLALEIQAADQRAYREGIFLNKNNKLSSPLPPPKGLADQVVFGSACPKAKA
jgi:hypothetical protein